MNRYGYSLGWPLPTVSDHTGVDAMWIVVPAVAGDVQALGCQTRDRSLGTLALPTRRKWHPYPLAADLINRMEG